MTLTYNHTKKASYLGTATQAIINNLAPLLFMTFQKQFSVTTGQIAFLISLNFVVQMIVDGLASLFADHIGWRISVVTAHVLAVIGLVGMGIFPFIFPTPFTGLLVAIVINAIGGGLIEVLISPIVEAIPGEKKTSEMSLLHSFYCWGHVAVVLLSTLFFATIGIEHWRILPILWAIVPLFNGILFTRVPLGTLVEDHEESISLKTLFTKKLFILFILMMICSGAAEQAMSQWSSFFAEVGLGVNKALGDLLGTCVFAFLMGCSRLLHGLYGHKIKLEKALLYSSVLCIVSYLVTVFAPIPIISLVACGITGFSVGLFWPGITSIASKNFRRGGTAMFALLALAGDIGCATGPGMVGVVTNLVTNQKMRVLSFWQTETDLAVVGLKTGLLIATIFAVILLIGFTYFRIRAKKGTD